MKKTKTSKLGIKKVTLKDLDESTLKQIAGASNLGGTCQCPTWICLTKVKC